jgi:hypothetical protein
MFKLLILLPFLFSSAFAGIGEITSLHGDGSYLLRAGSNITLTEGLGLEVGDTIHSENAHVSLLLYPEIQMGLVNGTELKITRHMVEDAESGAKTDSLIDLVKGLVRIQVSKDQGDEVQQKVDAGSVTFAVRGTEYEVSTTPEDAELDVFAGEVQVSSPLIQTFVPEIVKPNEGFRFDRKGRKFSRRAVRERNKQARFIRREQMRSMRQKRKAERQQNKNSRKEIRQQEKQARRDARQGRKKGKGR